MNPRHCIPTLKHGDFTLHESKAIANYIIGLVDNEAARKLYPEDPVVRARVDERSFFHETSFYPKAAQTMVAS